MSVGTALSSIDAAFWRLSTNRRILRVLYYGWIAFPLPIRKPLTALGILALLGAKKLTGVNRRHGPTPTHRVQSLSFWGVPPVDLETYTLRVDGLVNNPAELSFQDLLSLPSVERQIRMDCVGGFRNNTVMRGVTLGDLLQRVAPKPEAETAIFSCADGYHTTHRIADLLAADALLVYQVNGEAIERFGYPLRLAAPGTYGYKWAKWLVRIELVSGFPPGHWDRLGLPKRGKVGDLW